MYAVKSVGSARAQGCAGSRYPFLTQKERDVETGLDYFGARYYSSTQGRFTSPDEFTGGPDELFRFAENASENPTFYADLANPQSLNKYQYCYGNPLSYVDPDGHHGIRQTVGTTVRNPSISQRIKEGARQVGKTIIRTVNGAASTVSENNGFGRMDAEQNTAGRAIGHGLSAVQAGAEIYTGVTIAVRGAGGAIISAPACATGAGCAVPIVSAASAVLGVGITAHGVAVGVNTLLNIFSSKDDHPDTDKTSVQGKQDQLDDITANQEAQRKAGHPNAIEFTEKSKQRADTALKKVKSLKDLEDQ